MPGKTFQERIEQPPAVGPPEAPALMTAGKTAVGHGKVRQVGDDQIEVAVKGRRSKIPIYELLGVYGADSELEPDAATRRLGDLTREAYAAWVAQNTEAIDLYKKILCEFPDDTVARTFASRVGTA